MKNIKKLYNVDQVRIEAPKPMGKDVELFLQLHSPSTVATNSHIHSVIELIYVNSGDYTAILDGSELELSPGDLMLIPSNSIHFIQSDSGSSHSYYVIKIPPSALLDYSDEGRGIEYAMSFFSARDNRNKVLRKSELEGTRMKEILDRLTEEYKTENYASRLVIKLKITELLIEILRYGMKETNSITDEISCVMYAVMHYVNRNYAEEIDERELAARFGVSYGYFVRAFRTATGMSFREYLNRIRINQAHAMLLCRRMTVTEVAAACGYNSLSYFISTYKGIKGETPKETSRRSKIVK